MNTVFCDIHNHGLPAPYQLTSITPEEFTASGKISSRSLTEILDGNADPLPLEKAAGELLKIRDSQPVSLGIHPWFLKTRHTIEVRLKLIEYLASLKAIAAVGECGLDRRKSAFGLEEQKSVFVRQIAIAEKYSLPLIIHNVRCLPEILSLRKKYPNTAWIIHGFIGNDTEIDQCLRLNIMLSPGIALLLMNGIEYHRMYDFLRKIPPGKMFLETDGVDVNIETIYSAAAEYTGHSKEQTAEIILAEFRKLFL